MSWLAYMAIVITAIVSLVAYIHLGNTNQRTPQLYQQLDVIVCLSFVIYFLLLSLDSRGTPCSLEIADVQKGGLFYLMLDIAVLSLLSVRHISPGQAFGVWKLQALQLIKLSILSLAALYPLVFLVQIFLEKIQGIHPQQPLVQFLRQNTHYSDRAIVTLLAVVIAPLSEELIFRGYLYGVLRQHIGLLGAMLITSTLFAAIHQYWPVFPGLFLLAVGLSLVYELTGCLLVPILMHSLFNFIGIVATIF